MGVKLRERPGKGWGVFINWKGKRKAKFFGGNQKAAQLFAEKMAYRLKEAEQEGHIFSFGNSSKTMPTVKEYLVKWQETYAKPNCKPSTYRGYIRAIEQVLIPQFGHLPLNELEREHIRTLIAALSQQGKARNTIENYLVPVWSKNSCTLGVFEKFKYFNADEFLKGTGKEEENDVHAAECRAGGW